MAARRSGSPTSFWNNVVVSPNGVSNAVEVARRSDMIGIYVTANGATTISVEVAHTGALNADGTTNDANASNWGQLWYTNVEVKLVLASPGSACLLIPDFEPAWIRLKSSAGATITAGHEVTGD
jgi:hypothetical protein